MRQLSVLSFIMLATACSSISLIAALPEKTEVIGLRVDSLRADGIINSNKFNFNTEEMFHPYFTESVNAVLRKYKSAFGMNKILNENGQEPTISEYLDILRSHNVRIYKMRDLQGRVLRVLLNSQIPVLALKKQVTAKHNFSITRIQGTVIYLYREPNFVQSSRLEPGDKKYEFVSAFGGFWSTKDIEKIGLEHYNYFCVVTTPELPLKAIQQKLDSGLSDVGFEYKVPVFEELTSKNLPY